MQLPPSSIDSHLLQSVTDVTLVQMDPQAIAEAQPHVGKLSIEILNLVVYEELLEVGNGDDDHGLVFHVDEVQRLSGVSLGGLCGGG